MLLNDFYTCRDIVQNEREFSCALVFNDTHPIFGGHFPGQPVVPGVCMMEIVKEILQQQLGRMLTLQSAGNVKFLQLITPDIEPVISISWQEAEAGYTVKAAFRSPSAVLFKLDGNYVTA